MLRAQQLFQTAWLVALTPALLLAVRGEHLVRDLPWLAGWLALASATLLLWRRPRTGLVASLGVAAAIALLFVPQVLSNLYLWATDHAHYLDSPATIFVVAIFAGLTALPAVVVLFMSFTNWGFRGVAQQ